MRFTDPKQVKIGTILFEVSCFQSDSCTLTKYEVTRLGCGKDGSFIRAKRLYVTPTADWLRLNVPDKKWEDVRTTLSGTERDRSLMDMGIIPNTYNRHQTFDNLKAAIHYAETQYGIVVAKTPSEKDVADDKDSHADFDHAMKIF